MLATNKARKLADAIYEDRTRECKETALEQNIRKVVKLEKRKT
jgi:DNA-directed RNA polymerase sigma subunit (sigma70/sigma32)